MLLGASSWVAPGTYLENARLLVGKVDFVELLTFSWDLETIRLLKDELKGLQELPFQYSVHLPLDSAANARTAVDFFEDRAFPVLNYVLHPLDGWQDIAWNEKVSLENLVNRVEPFERMVFDVGHHALGLPFPEEWASRITEVHLMGVEGDRDHLALNEKGLELARPFLREDVPVCFEVFDLAGLDASLENWRRYVAR